MARVKKEEETPILSALRYMALAQDKEGQPHQMHCRIVNGTISAYDSILAVGQLLPMELPDCCPNTFQFIHALERAKDTSSIIIEQGFITVRTAKFKAIVPTIGGHDIPFVQPDAAQWPLTDAFRDAALRASVYTKEGAQRVVESSILTTDGGLIGTNGMALVEAWHGMPTPPGLALPMSFVQAVNKIKRRITHFGFSQSDVTGSFTVWFDDQSFVKTQVYGDPWPDTASILAAANVAVPQDLPKDFWAAVEAVAPFSIDGQVYFRDEQIFSHRGEGLGAAHKCKGIPAQHFYGIKQLKPLEKIIDKVDFTGNERSAVFMGDNCRAILMKGTH